jgi:hypothetical protein
MDGATLVAELQDTEIFITVSQPFQILVSERVRSCCDLEWLRQVATEFADSAAGSLHAISLRV